MTKFEESQGRLSSIHAYRLKMLGELILKKLDKIEKGELPDVSFQLLHERLLELSVRLSPKGEDILKSLAHHLIQVQSVRHKETTQFMRTLVRDLFDAYQLEIITYNVINEKSNGKGSSRPNFLTQRMKQASLVHDIRKLVL